MKRKDKALLDACRGEPCYIQMPFGCLGHSETVVPAHANWSEYGKGMGIKAYDHYTVPACRSCHTELDQGKNYSKVEKKRMWERAFQVWHTERIKKIGR